MDKGILYSEIKQAAHIIEPDARIIIYGSYARNEELDESDVDIMIIVNRESMTWQERRAVCYSVYNVERKNFIPLSPFVLTVGEWYEKKNSTPFYENVVLEGIEI